MNVPMMCRLTLIAALAFMEMSGHAFAQAWPNRPIKMLMPFAAGGGTDMLARAVADEKHALFGGTARRFYRLTD